MELIALEFEGKTCDLAVWCKLLRDKGMSGPQIAKALARSEGYVNNLIRVVERGSAALLLRWKQEQDGMFEHVCATDWLVQVCMLPHPDQDRELEQRIERFRTKRPSSQPNPNSVSVSASIDDIIETGESRR